MTLIYWAKYRLDTGEVKQIGFSHTAEEMRSQVNRDPECGIAEADQATIVAGPHEQATFVQAVRVPRLAAIDSGAAARLDPLLPSPAMAAIYAAKEAEARDWKANKASAVTPFLDAEAAATGGKLSDLATAVLGKADAFRSSAAKIEAKRRWAKQAIRSAATVRDILAAGHVDWDA